VGFEATAGNTHYLWGSFDPNYYLSRAIYRIRLDGGTLAMPLTSPFGPGCSWITAEANLGFPAGFGAAVSYRFVRRLAGVDLFTTPYEKSATIESGPYGDSHRFEASVSWRRQALDLHAGLRLDAEAGTLVPSGWLGASLRWLYEKDFPAGG
jgi:hypothetical protein